MDMNKKEIDLAQQIEAQAAEWKSKELTDLQLALIGGGCGVDIFY